MFSSVSNFIKRHKWKLASGVGISAGVYMLKRYLDAKVAEMEREALQFHFARARREEHFASNESSSIKAVESYLPEFSEAIEQTLAIEDIIAEVKALPKNDKSVRPIKLSCFKKIGIKTFTGVVAGSYLLSLMVVFLRVQLNILGGYAFLTTMPERGETAAVVDEVQREYLALVRHLQGEGTHRLVAWVEKAVESALVDAEMSNPTAFVNCTDIQKVLSNTLERLNRSLRAKESPFEEFLLPAGLPDGDSTTAGGERKSLAFGDLVRDTRDVLEAKAFGKAVHVSVDRCIAHVTDGIRLALEDMTVDPESPDGKPYRLMKVLIPVKDQYRLIFNVAASPMHDLFSAPAIKDLSKSVYESFSELGSASAAEATV